MKKIIFFGIVLFLIFSFTSIAQNDEFVYLYSGDEEFIILTTSGNDEFQYFENAVDMSSTPIVEIVEGGGGRRSSSNNQIVEEPKISEGCLAYYTRLELFIEKGITTKKNIYFKNDCGYNISHSFSCVGNTCSFFTYDSFKFFPNNITTNYTLLINIPYHEKLNAFNGSLILNSSENISVNILVNVPFKESLKVYIQEDSIVKNVPRSILLPIIFIIFILIIYLLLFKLTSPLVALSIAILLPLIGIITYIIIHLT